MKLNSSILLGMLFFWCSGLLVSCGNAPSGDDAENSVKTTSTKASKKNSTKAGKCFEKYFGENMANLLTKEEIAKHVDLDLDDAVIQDYTGHSEMMQQYYYQIKAGEEREKVFKVAGESIPIDYEAGIEGLKVYKERIKDPLERFQTENHTPTEEDMENIEAATQKAKDQVEEGREAQREEAANTVARMANKLKFIQIDGLGDAAAWSSNFHYLNILVGRTVVQINVDVSDDEEKNIAIAKKLTEEILKKI